MGYRLVLAQDGEEAVRQFLAHRDVISLVLLDVIMPKVDGPDAYERICQAKPGVPVIFTSGYSDQGALLKATATKGCRDPAETLQRQGLGAQSARTSG